MSRGLSYEPEEIRARGLPGVRPVGDGPWLLVRDDYPAQMAERERLLAGRRDDVLALLPEGCAAAGELLEQVVGVLPTVGFSSVASGIRCPDGRVVALDRGDPLGVLGRLLQADFCLLQKQGEEHVLVGAVLCFPSHWTLAEKLGKPLMRIHKPVPDYRPAGHRVQRLFDGVQAGRPLWRANLLGDESDALFQPLSEAMPRDQRVREVNFIRSERQVIWRLPESRDVVFAIETSVWPLGAPPQVLPIS
ncbi:heme-dependent oxidative N-demethylase family protein [Aestuariibius sp. 2305UL40-4]|uniref:heme-dependent oxidative N-demethylase family protein n=1 Tax=Aestuariibius violaceus TaxID=3234132 RepID=UPI00345E69B1